MPVHSVTMFESNIPFWIAAPMVVSIQRQSLGSQSSGSVPGAPTANAGIACWGSAPAALAAIAASIAACDAIKSASVGAPVKVFSTYDLTLS